MTMTQTLRVPPSTRPSRLRDARVYAGFTQEEIAEHLGVSRQTVSNYEREATPVSRAVSNLWADECDVDRIWLWTGLTTHGGPDGGVHPPGLEPGTHWLRANVTQLRPPARHDERGPGRRAA